MEINKLVLVASMSALLAGVTPVFAAAPVTLYKSPSCDCCNKYVDYLRDNKYTVQALNESDMNAIKHKHGMEKAASCHTALIDGYVVEGHVPVAAIGKLLKERPDIVGISAPGMPMNSPGMGEMKKGTLTIYAVPKNGLKPYVFSVE